MLTETTIELLTEIQAQTLQAVVNRVIPADDYPNGWEAGVGAYLTSLLTRDPSLVSVYQTGLNALEAGAGLPGFAGLTPDAQDALLARLEAEGSPFFRLLVAQTMEGFYADPANGGNQDGTAWKMLGFEVTA